MAPATSALSQKTTLLLVAFATLQRVAAQGGVGLTYSAATAGCPSPLGNCVPAGYDYIYDLTGNAVFVPKDTAVADNCDAWLGFAGAGSTTATGTLQLTSDGTNFYSAAYTPTQMTVTPVAGCTLTFSRGSSSSSDVGAIAYSSFTGGNSCAPDACLLSGYNFIVAGTSVAFLSRSGNSSLACYGYVGTATPVTSSINIDYALTGSSVMPIMSGVTATYSDTSITLSTTLSGSACSYTFTQVASSSASGRSYGHFAVVAMASTVAVMFF